MHLITIRLLSNAYLCGLVEHALMNAVLLKKLKGLFWWAYAESQFLVFIACFYGDLNGIINLRMLYRAR